MCGVIVLSEKGKANRDIPDVSLTVCLEAATSLDSELGSVQNFRFQESCRPSMALFELRRDGPVKRHTTVPN